MKILEFYTGNKTYMYPSGAIATPEQIEQEFPAVKLFTHIVETDSARQVCFAIQNFSAMRDFYHIDESLTDEEALAVMQEIINTPESEPEVSDETRIADALEDLVVLNMPDEEVE